jgi:DtxR family transcriptional regulator, Mn-dependent transcriptional regulator
MSRSCTNAGQLTPAIEDYLRAILTLVGADDATTICAIADRLAVSRASVSQMVRRLVSLDLVSHDRYGSVGLTLAGTASASDVLRRYRLIESYLVTALGYPPEMGAAEADQIEHAMSDQLSERLSMILGVPVATEAPVTFTRAG